MSVAPVVAWPLLLLFVVAGALLVWLPSRSSGPPAPLGTRVRRTVAVGLLAVAGMRPGTSGGDITVNAADLNVFFVVDTTTSVMAEDWNGSATRLEGIREDVKAVAREVAGARFALISFDHEAVVRMPLTVDGGALASAVDTLQPESSDFSRGSSVTVAGPTLIRVLDRAAEAHPERARVVVYLGDGEQTSGQDPRPMGIPDELFNAGIVLGYGTAEGGRMKETGAAIKNPQRPYLKDPETGEDAVSRIDEEMLRRIGEDLGVPYVRREAGQSIRAALDKMALDDLGAVATAQTGVGAGGRTELYWPLLLAVAALAAWETGLIGATWWRLRRRPSPVPAERSTS